MSQWDKHDNTIRKIKFSDYRYDEYHDDLCPLGTQFDKKLMSTHSDNLRDEYRNISYNRFKNMGKLTKFSTYEFINNGENFELKSYKHNFKKINLKNYIKNLSDDALTVNHIKYGLPLPINDHCKLVGVVNGKRRKGYTNLMRKYEDDLFLKDLDITPDMNIHEDEFLYMKPFSGDWRYNSQNLIDMATKKQKQFSRHDIIEGYLSRVGVDFSLPYVGDYDSKLILGLDVKPKAFSGFSTSVKIGKFRKVTSPYTKDYAKKYVDMIMKNDQQILDTSLLVIGGREKRVKFDSDEKNKRLKTRVTCMGEDVPTLISQSLVNPITNCIPEIPDHFNQLAKVYGQGGYKRFIESMSPSYWDQVICDLDFSGHDNNTSSDQIAIAFAFLRLCFKPSVNIDRLFFYCMSSMIHKNLVLPESNMVYHIDKGISTGHGFTSLVTTMCAYGTLATSLRRVVLDKIMKEYPNDSQHSWISQLSKELEMTYIANAGDDCTIKIRARDVQDLYDDVILNSGHKIDDITNCSYIISNDSLNRVTFIKKQFMDFSWNPPELYSNLVHPILSQRGLNQRPDNMKVNIYQSPLSLTMNNFLMFLTVYYILLGDPNTYRIFYEARKAKEIICIYDFILMCKKFKFYSVDFSEKLKSIDYGEFSHYLPIGKKTIYKKTFPLHYQTKISLNRYIKDVLNDISIKIPKRQNWFLNDVKYKMHRVKNTLTVYDFLKTFTYPKSNNLSYDSLRIFYTKMTLSLAHV